MELVFIGIYIFFLVFILFYSLMELNLLFLYLFKSEKDQKTEVQEFPFVTIQLPVYNEKYVIERLIDACCNFSYPKEKIEIQVLDDSTDETIELIKNRVEYWRAKNCNISHVRRLDRKGYKAGSLSYGMKESRGEFIAIFDADFIPDRHFLKDTLPFFNQIDLGVVQTRWKHLNKNYSLLTKLQALALDAHFTVEQKGRNKGGHFINFNGTAGIWRRACIEDAGGWNSDTLTEDLDLSYRAQMNGWKFRYLEDVESPSELPVTMSALKNQQFRWAKGAAECARKNLWNVLKKRGIGFRTKLMALFHLFNSFLFICIISLSIMSIPLMFIIVNHPEHQGVYDFLLIFALSTLILGAVYMVGSTSHSDNKLKDRLKFLLYYPAFLSVSMSLSLYNAIGVIEGYLGKKSPFVRTPKFNVSSDNDDQNKWQNNQYINSIKNFGLITWLEIFAILYFVFGFVVSIIFYQFTLVPFYAMLVFGFTYSLVMTIKHTSYASKSS